MVLTLSAKEAMWLRLLLTERNLLGISEQYAEIKILRKITRIKQILANIRDQNEKAIPLSIRQSKMKKTAQKMDKPIFYKMITSTNISFY